MLATSLRVVQSFPWHLALPSGARPLRTPVWPHCTQLGQWPPVFAPRCTGFSNILKNWSSSIVPFGAFIALALSCCYSPLFTLPILCYTKLYRKRLSFVLLSQVDKFLLITPSPKRSLRFISPIYYRSTTDISYRLHSPRL
jgi:hypothetical protein